MLDPLLPNAALLPHPLLVHPQLLVRTQQNAALLQHPVAASVAGASTHPQLLLLVLLHPQQQPQQLLLLQHPQLRVKPSSSNSSIQHAAAVVGCNSIRMLHQKFAVAFGCCCWMHECCCKLLLQHPKLQLLDETANCNKQIQVNEVR